MAEISNFNDFNLIPNIPMQPIVDQPKQETVIKYIPNIMHEQRENFKTMFEILDLMESKGMITINRPEVLEVQENKGNMKEFLIGAGIIFAIIRLGILLL